MSETQPIPIEMVEFAKNMLGTTKTTDNIGNKISLSDSLGDRYSAYEDLVLERMRYINLPPTKRPEEKEFESQFQQRAREAGFSGRSLQGIQRRVRTFYQSWLTYKHGQQVAEQIGVISIKGGKDPNAYLGDGSSRRQLGYIQNQGKET